MIDERPECRDALNWLQRRMDGAREPISPRVEAHVAECADCRGRIAMAERVFAAFPRVPAAPEFLSARAAAAVQVDHRRREARRWLAAGAALAAAVVLAVWLSAANRRNERDPDGLAKRSPAAPSLRDALVEAGTAAVAASRQSVAATLGESRLLIPPIDVPKAAAWIVAANTPADGAARGVSGGLQPVAASARRAAQLFLGDTGPTDRPN